MGDHQWSGFVNPHKILNPVPTNGAVLQILAALDAGSVMLAGHVHAVLVILETDDTRIRVGLLAHHRCLDLAGVGLVRSELEHKLVGELVVVAGLTLAGQPLPGAVGGAQVLNEVLSVDGVDGGVHVAEVLVVGEVQQVGLLAPDRHLAVLGDLDHVALGGALDYLQREDALQEVSLELVGPHLDDHVLHDLHLLVDLDEGARGAAGVPDVEFLVGELDLRVESGDALVQDKYLVGGVSTYLGPLFLHGVERVLGPIILLDNQLELLLLLFALLIDHGLGLFDGVAAGADLVEDRVAVLNAIGWDILEGGLPVELLGLLECGDVGLFLGLLGDFLDLSVVDFGGAGHGQLQKFLILPQPLGNPYIHPQVHDIIFLIVMPDLMLSSSLRSCSVRELRQLPSMDSYSKQMPQVLNLSKRVDKPMNWSQICTSVMVHLIGYFGSYEYSLGQSICLFLSTENV